MGFARDQSAARGLRCFLASDLRAGGVDVGDFAFGWGAAANNAAIDLADGFDFDGRERRGPYQSYANSPTASSSASAFVSGASRHSVPQVTQIGPRVGLGSSARTRSLQNEISSSSSTRSVVPCRL